MAFTIIKKVIKKPIYSTIPGHMSESCTDQNLIILLVVDIVVSFFAFIASMRWRMKCGDNICSCKPKDAALSPGSDPSVSPDGHGAELHTTALPNGAVAVVIEPEDTPPHPHRH